MTRFLLTMLVVSGLMLGAATPGHAKCGFAKYRLSVRVLATAMKTPVAAARVSVFANGSDRELARRGDALAPETGEDGAFAGEYWVGTDSGWSIFGDRCNGRAKTFELVVTHPHHRARRITLRGNALRVHGGEDALAFDVVLPPIELDRLDQR